MTDKEWKELCEWTDNKHPHLHHGSDWIGFKESLWVYNNGDIEDGYKLLARNRTPAQIKSIIENLL